ncbi:MAG TPA: DsrE family protein [Burkholderiaceae bacterium]|nr:DsrE family protein [Burkholderiaceae bacterium]
MAARRIVIVLWSCGPDRADGARLAAAPLVYAQAARALELDVEVHFTGTTVRWLFEGVAADAFTDRALSKTVLDYLRETHAAGATLYACAMALGEHRHGETLIAEVAGVAGATTVIDHTTQDGTRTLVF